MAKHYIFLITMIHYNFNDNLMLTFFYRFISAIEEAFSPLLAACFLILMCSLCFSSYTTVLVIVTGTHNVSLF
jgi:hypothetical protein